MEIIMNHSREHRESGESPLFRLLVAILLILVGASALLAKTVFDTDIRLLDMWPLIFVFAGFAHLRRRECAWHVIEACLGIATGLFLLANNIFGFITFSWSMLLPLLLILIGFSCIGKSFKISSRQRKIE